MNSLVQTLFPTHASVSEEDSPRRGMAGAKGILISPDLASTQGPQQAGSACFHWKIIKKRVILGRAGWSRSSIASWVRV